MHVDAIIHQERLDRGIIAIFDGSKCDSKDTPAVIKSIALNEDPEFLFVLVLYLPPWTRHLRDLVEVGNNIDFLVVLVAELTHRHGLYTVVIQSADKLGGGIRLYGLHHFDHLRGRVSGHFNRFRGVGIPFIDAS